MIECERRYVSGEKRALIDAIYMCVCSRPQLPVPTWARIAFAEAMFKIVHARVGSWDHVFGDPVIDRWQRGGRKRLAAQRRAIDLKHQIWSYCWSRVHAGEPLRELFGEAAKAVGCTQREARELYYAAKKSGWKPPQDPKEMQRVLREIGARPLNAVENAKSVPTLKRTRSKKSA
jgi:hypothetical protein